MRTEYIYICIYVDKWAGEVNMVTISVRVDDVNEGRLLRTLLRPN